MIVALFVLALAMIVGGIASIVQGAPFIRLEMGWTMVIAGSVAMSGGAVLAGVAAAVWRLRRIELELIEARETGARLPPMPAIASPLPPGTVPPPAPEEHLAAFAPAARREPALELAPAVMPVTAPLAPDERAVLAAGDLMPPLSARRDEEPAPFDLAAAIPPERREAPRVPAEPEAAAAPAAEADIHHAPQVHADPVAHEEPAPPNPPADPVEAEAGEAPAAEPPPRMVAGTYTSGGNTYVMYSDGSIEAETPGGKYTFSSLEELKAFASKEAEGTPVASQA